MREILKLIDLQTNPRLIKEDLVGRKVATLKYLLLEEEDRIPPFFVVTADVFRKLYTKLGDIKPAEFRQVQEHVMEYVFPSRFVEALESAYKSLGRFSNPHVAVRSTVSAAGYPLVSFSGVFPTYLNVRGVPTLVRYIKHVYSSFFSPSVFNYLNKHRIKPEEISLAVMVQKMIMPEVSGVAYVMNPITHSTDSITIEAVFGIGDVIARGEVNPDIYFVRRSTLELEEKKVNPQYWMRSFINEPDQTTGDYTVKVELAKIWHHTPKLTDQQITELAKIVNPLADKFRDLTVEWVYSNGKFWIMQVKGVPIVGIKSKKNSVSPKIGKGLFPIVNGLPLSYGEAVGKAVVLNADILNTLDRQQLIKRIEGKIVVAPRFYPQLREVLADRKVKVLGIILDIGSPRSDAAYFLEELKIPAVGATFNATRLLKDGVQLRIDARSGSVFLM